MRWIAAVSAMILGLGMAIATAPERADAYALLGCKWNTYAIRYHAPAPLLSHTAWTTAASSWNSAITSGPTLSNNASDPHIHALNENRGNTVAWTGVTRKRGTVQTPPTCSTSGVWQRGQMDVVLNWSLQTSYGYTTAQRRMVAAHEFGHAFGLAHYNSLTSADVPKALMYAYDNKRIEHKVYSPKNDDKVGINALY